MHLNAWVLEDLRFHWEAAGVWYTCMPRCSIYITLCLRDYEAKGKLIIYVLGQWTILFSTFKLDLFTFEHRIFSKVHLFIYENHVKSIFGKSWICASTCLFHQFQKKKICTSKQNFFLFAWHIVYLESSNNLKENL